MKTLLLLLLLPAMSVAAPFKIADLDRYFGQHPSNLNVALCAGINDRCGPIKYIPNTQGPTPCILSNFSAPVGVSGLACYAEIVAGPTVPPVVPPVALVPVQLCWVFNPMAYNFEKVPATVSSYYTDVAYWVSDCAGKLEIMPFNSEEFLRAWSVLKDTPTRAAFNEYIKTQPIRPSTENEIAYFRALRIKHTPVAPQPVTYWVQPVSILSVGDRPVYRLRADGTRNTTAVAGIRVPGKTPCDITKRIGATNYFLVPGLGYYAVCVPKP